MPDRVGHDGKEGGHPEWIIFAFHLLAERRHWRRFPAGPPLLHSLSLYDDAIVSLLIGYTLRVPVRQFQCQVCIDHDLATDLTDCRTDPFAVLDSPRRGRAAAEEGLYSFEAIDQVLLFRRHFLRFLP